MIVQILALLVGAASTLMVLVETMEMTMTTKRTDSSNALDAFIVRKREIDVMLQRLVACSDDHFGVAPEEVNWGHVGNLGYVIERLREAAWQELLDRGHGRPTQEVREEVTVAHKDEPIDIVEVARRIAWALALAEQQSRSSVTRLEPSLLASNATRRLP